MPANQWGKGPKEPMCRLFAKRGRFLLPSPIFPEQPRLLPETGTLSLAIVLRFLEEVLMLATKTITDLQTLIEARDFVALREQIKNWTSGDIADLMEPLPADQEAIVFRLLPREQAAAVFSYLS